jgi:endogenous inhibitor of DNA gyrase (YacG/DUF329 family)
MTIFRIDEITKIAGRNRRYVKKIIILKCDYCGIEFICREDSKNRALKQELHFCSKKCSNTDMSTGGKLSQKQSAGMIKEYGVASFFDTVGFKKEQQEFCFEKYGVKSRLESPIILNKIKKTNLEKYGQEIYAGSEDWESKLDRDEIARKAWLTKISNGSCSKSNQEDLLYEILVGNFDQINIQRQVPIIKQWIDFYIQSLNLYIQVDGIYWHGLNRDIETIKLGLTTQDKKIYKQILRDKELNNYMRINNMKLLRITDEQIKKLSSEEIIKIILKAGN